MTFVLYYPFKPPHADNKLISLIDTKLYLQGTQNFVFLANITSAIIVTFLCKFLCENWRSSWRSGVAF